MPVVTPKLGLTAWTSITDPYDSDQLADNWFKVDQHDHSQGRGVQISSGGIADGAITPDKLDPALLNGLTGTTGAGMPPGSVINTAAATPPPGWLICDGTSYLRADYEDLFDSIGTTYGQGSNPGTTFQVPNAQERVIVGSSGGMVRGAVGGAKTVALNVDQMPSHTHTVVDPGHGHTVHDPGHNHTHTVPSLWNDNNPGTAPWRVVPPSGAVGEAGANATYVGIANSGTNVTILNRQTGVYLQSRGSGNPHENMPPFLVLLSIIKT